MDILKIKKELVNSMIRDMDFLYLCKDKKSIKKFVDNIDINNYILEKEYIDVSYVIIHGVIFNLDDMYLDFKDYINN